MGDMKQAEAILARFKEHGITQERLATELGCRQNVLAGWKRRGFVPAPQQPRVLRAAERLSVPLTAYDFIETAEAAAA